MPYLRHVTALFVLSVMACASRLPEASPDVTRWVGEYGIHDSLITVYENDGRLFATGMNTEHTPLRLVAPGHFSLERPGSLSERRMDFEVDARHQVVAVVYAGHRLPLRDVGQETVDLIRAGLRTDADALAAAAHAQPPAEAPAKRPFDLVDLARFDPSIKFDIRYATADNFMGFALYRRAEAYLQRPAAEALRRVERSLEPSGYGLLVYDAYRPWYVTQMFWIATPPAAHVFVADPAQGSRHNRGCAVDLTLFERASGQPVVMTSRYDEMSHRSYADYPGGTTRQRRLRDLLRRAMEQQGFTVYPEEWWHFDYDGWRDYAIGNIAFEELDGTANMNAVR